MPVLLAVAAAAFILAPLALAVAVDVQVRGIFSTGAPELDKRLVYVHLTTAQEVLRTGKISSLSVYLTDTDQTVPVTGGTGFPLNALAMF